MYPSRARYPARPPQQKGSMLVIAIFTIVVLALLGLAMVRLNSTASSTVVTEVYGLRALSAANIGLEAALLNAFPNDGSTATCTTNSQSFSSDGLVNCSYSSRCASTLTDIDFSGVEYDILHLSSTGSCTAGDHVVSRTLTVEAIRESD